MKRFSNFKCATICVVFFFSAISCNQTATDDTTKTKSETDEATTAIADPVKLKAEIQEMETAWATADNARDLNAMAAFYAEDAVSLENNMPMIVGNAAIKKNIESYMGKREKGSTVVYDVMDVYGGGNYATEVGKTMRKDSTGKVTSTSKYMAIWEKRNGKWICIRDIGNDDAEKK